MRNIFNLLLSLVLMYGITGPKKLNAQVNFGGGLGYYSKWIAWTGPSLHGRVGYFVNDWLNLDGNVVFQLPNSLGFYAIQFNADAQFWVVNKQGIFYPFAGINIKYLGWSGEILDVPLQAGGTLPGINIGLGGGFRVNDNWAITSEFKAGLAALKFQVGVRYLPQ